MASSTPPVAIITGAASGIGLALIKHLYSQGWKVYMADISPTGSSVAASIPTSSPSSPSSPSPPPTFIQTDVSSFASQATLFKTAYTTSGHIDLVAANAGIDDRESPHGSFPLSADPTEPDLTTLDVDLKAVFYGLKLFVHYVRKEKETHPSANPDHGDVKETRQKKFIPTASIMGLYPFPAQPVYGSAKAGVINLVRSVGSRFLEEDNIAVNAICPAFVATGLAPPGVVAVVEGKGYLTPMSSIIRAYEELIGSDERAGETVEVSGTELYWRKPVGFANWGSRWLADDPDGLWRGSYRKKEVERGEAGEEGTGEKVNGKT
ncbi:hypothetical protein MMC10_007065 [Thelotrema lepadinum]|nr:hypothetical protein [Thelotrema lepadinum]